MKKLFIALLLLPMISIAAVGGKFSPAESSDLELREIEISEVNVEYFNYSDRELIVSFTYENEKYFERLNVVNKATYQGVKQIIGKVRLATDVYTDYAPCDEYLGVNYNLVFDALSTGSVKVRIEVVKEETYDVCHSSMEQTLIPYNSL